MVWGAALLAAALSCRPCKTAPYALSRSYQGRDFFERWTFWTDADPTHGFVEFVDRETAFVDRLVQADDHRAYIGADLEGVAATSGRRSVRIQSLDAYEKGLFVASIDHVPTGCGTWSAFWMYGEDPDHPWPEWGEYDIIEGVHTKSNAVTSLHTGAHCDQSHLVAGRHFAGSWSTGPKGNAADNCDVEAEDQWTNQGCSQEGLPNSFGAPFNAGGGGTFAAEWDPEAGHIRTWFWPAGAEPAQLANQVPEPDTWGTPSSFYSLDPEVCSANHFSQMRLVFDTTFCGDLGDATFSVYCPDLAASMTCQELVASHPEHLRDAYWSVRRIDVFQRGNPFAPSSVPPTATSSPFASPAPPKPDVVVIHVGGGQEAEPTRAPRSDAPRSYATETPLVLPRPWPATPAPVVLVAEGPSVPAWLPWLVELLLAATLFALLALRARQLGGWEALLLEAGSMAEWACTRLAELPELLDNLIPPFRRRRVGSDLGMSYDTASNAQAPVGEMAWRQMQALAGRIGSAFGVPPAPPAPLQPQRLEPTFLMSPRPPQRPSGLAALLHYGEPAPGLSPRPGIAEI